MRMSLQKFLLPLVLMIFALVSFAGENASIQCETKNGKTIVATLSGHWGDFWEYCQEKLHVGDVCFKGKQFEVTSLLAQMDWHDILGDEYRIINVEKHNMSSQGPNGQWYEKRSIRYDVYDGPNEEIIEKNMMKEC